MSKPLIGLTTTRINNSYGFPTSGVNLPYTRSIASAGGIPILVPSELCVDDLDKLIARIDGIIFTGGYDIDPTVYGNQPHPLVENVDAERDRLECHLVQVSIAARKPFLGICRGLQVINVALGGTLYEDLPSQFPGNIHLKNHDKPRNFLAHTVEIVNHTFLAQIMSQNPSLVNSLHHQGVRQLATGLRPSAIAPDGLVEAVELPGESFGLAVQWHPEELQENPDMRRLFQVFVHACQAK